MLRFILEHQEYDYYWGIEYDVHFEGKWSTFMERFRTSSADLIATTICKHSEIPRKNLNPVFRSPASHHFDEERWIKAFLPIYRLSKRGAEAIHNAYRDGCGGHYELTWATIIEHAGLELEDIGGDGAWVRPENRNRFYFNTPRTWSRSPGTFVFRPPFRTVLHRRNTLWHPVKPVGIHGWFSEPERQGVRRIITTVKQYVSKIVVRAWFFARWRPLKD
jgi:hypothetical protein